KHFNRDASEHRKKSRHRHLRIHQSLILVANFAIADAVRSNFDYASRHRTTADSFDIDNHEIKILERPAFDLAILDHEEVSFDTKPRIILNKVSDQRCGQIFSRVCQAKY